MTGVAIITGAGAGLGARTAVALAAADHPVVVNTRSDRPGAQLVVDEITAAGGEAVVACADVTRPAEVRAMFELADDLGPLSVLVNNASLRRVQRLEEVTLEDFRAVVAVTLDGAYTCSRAALQRMERGGRIINILGENALAGDPRRVHVSAAKHGLLGVTLAMANALRNRGITVNAVSPLIDGSDPEDLVDSQQRVVSVVALLASEAAAHVTGTVVTVESAEASRRARPAPAPA